MSNEARAESIEKINSLDHLGLIRRVLRSLPFTFNEHLKEDLFQVGYLGLHNAALRFDPSQGYRFSSYAYPLIRGEISHYLRDKLPLIRQSRNPDHDRHVVVSLDRKLRSCDDQQTLGDTIADLRRREDWGFHEALTRIDRKNAIALHLTICDDMTFVAAAKILGCSPITVDRRTQRGIAQLRVIYGVN